MIYLYNAIFIDKISFEFSSNSHDHFYFKRIKINLTLKSLKRKEHPVLELS